MFGSIDSPVDPMGNPQPGVGADLPAGADVGYFQQKVAEFQNLMDELDTVQLQTQILLSAGVDDPELVKLLDEFDAKKSSFRTAAEGLNFAVNGLNKFGLSIPNVTVPTTLQAVPIAAIAAVSAAIAVVASLIVWGRDWIAGVNARAQFSLSLANIQDPAKRDQAAAAAAGIASASAAAQASPLSSIANIVKWVAIAAVAYFAFQAYAKVK